MNPLHTILIALLPVLHFSSTTVLASRVVHESDHSPAARPQLTWTAGEGHQHPLSSSHDPTSDYDRALPIVDFSPVEELRSALDVMQDTWYEVWLGTWPSAIDWTRAVVDTLLVSSLNTLGKVAANHEPLDGSGIDPRDIDNDINKYFTQNVAYYFGEDAFSLRNQAYDDMLWVVLGWLEGVKFIQSHCDRHASSGLENLKPWHGRQFVQSYSHRAHVFWELASRGWDTEFCNGGMVWNSYLAPYKNAITNELFIAASASMYLYFPGDNNTSPFMLDDMGALDLDPAQTFDPKYLQAAVEGYEWLKNSNMTNGEGLYIDGFHVSGWKEDGNKCDIRNDMVYTYNQGVILSGLRGLWESTGHLFYLEDGHELARNAIKATGWDFRTSRPTETKEWAGLGRNGILEDHCDAAGDCDQDAQTFKGIFFHHLRLFCEPLPLRPRVPGKTHCALKDLAFLHRQSCREYSLWTAHNAQAALATRDEEGRFGQWWGAGEDLVSAALPENPVDYRKHASELSNPLWKRDSDTSWSSAVQNYGTGDVLNSDGQIRSAPSNQPQQHPFAVKNQTSASNSKPKDRRLRPSVETQSGGVAVLSALIEMLGIA